ncbi:hypothetical protein [Frigoriglobus tundricola]|uniref:Uncharacterized protein n=1 Tax=Frigoriglobus tundricola TaxID=2774151 RepID=A0A6M5Z3B9_9BACT|nr:hypothetical protein [Frigoriglobus tundricola]QJW99931.1 hypothetical protein FTUN_7554 [Frigoriglobus tundricola]
MNFAELPPSKNWAALKFRGELFAEVWFKPENEPYELVFRIPQKSFQIPGGRQRLVLENLLKAVGITTEEVEFWSDEHGANTPTQEIASDLKRPLIPPPRGVTHLDLFVTLKPPETDFTLNIPEPEATEVAEAPEPVEPLETQEPPPETVAPVESGEVQPAEPTNPPALTGAAVATGGAQIDESIWQFLETRWAAILGLEAAVDNMRNNMDSLRSEMEAAASKTLPLEVKVNAMSVDLVQWNKAKSRIRYAVPKAREFIHRATWATGTAERKKLAEWVEAHVAHRVPFDRLEEVLLQFEALLKDRQALSAQGTTVYQECKSICADCQSTMRTLQSNASANASRKKGGLGKGKHFRT